MQQSQSTALEMERAYQTLFNAATVVHPPFRRHFALRLFLCVCCKLESGKVVDALGTKI